MTHDDPQLEGALATLQTLRAGQGDHGGAAAAQAELANIRKAQAAPSANPQPTRRGSPPTCGAAADAYWDRIQREQREQARKPRPAKPMQKTAPPKPRAKTTASIEQQARMRQAVDATRRATVERGGIYA